MGFQGYSDVEPLVEDMQSNLGTLYEVMQDAQQCLALKLKNLQDALIKMVSNPPIASDTNIDTTTKIDSIDEITIDELEIADESLKSINISFDPKTNEQFQIQSPSIDNTSITIEESEHENLDQTETEEHTQITHYIGKLRLVVEKGMDLEKKDLFQKSDPYVKVILGQQTSKSKKVKNTLNPVWNHEVVSELDKSTPMEIKIEVYDWDRFGKDDIMGFAKLNLDEEIPKNQHGTYSIPLEDCKSGKIYLSLKFDGEIVKSQRIIKGVRDLKKYLTEGQVDESKTIIKKTTTSKHVIKKTIIAEDGSKNIIVENVQSSAAIKSENPKEAEKEKANDSSKNKEWINIPIIRLDNLPSGVEIQELSDEEQNEPIDMTNKLLVEGVVTTPSDEESVQETIEIEEITDDEPIDLTVKHKPLSTESSLSSNSSVITVLELEKTKSKEAEDVKEKWSVNIPIIRATDKKEPEDNSKPQDRWSVNIPIIKIKEEKPKETPIKIHVLEKKKKVTKTGKENTEKQIPIKVEQINSSNENISNQLEESKIVTTEFESNEQEPILVESKTE